MSTPQRIDVHHHPSPPSYLATRFSRDRRYEPQEGWSAAKSLEDMERGGVTTSMLSLPHSREIFTGGAGEMTRLVRDWNEFMAQLARDHPGRFGVFAALPILDIDASLKEIEYAYETLKVEGVTLMTNIGDRWLGDAHYAPVFEELNRRDAVVYSHPVAPTCCRGVLPEINDSVIEYGTDTTRAIGKLLFSGSATRFPRIRFIFSHAGGTLPYLTERFVAAHRQAKARGKDVLPEGVLPALNKLYYDTAQAAHAYAMGSFLKAIDASQLVFGTDFPYRTASEHVKGLKDCGCFTDAELRAIDCENAWRILPQLKK